MISMVGQVIGNKVRVIGMIASLAVGIKMHVPVHHLITVTGIKAPGICMVNKLASKAEARHQKGM